MEIPNDCLIKSIELNKNNKDNKLIKNNEWLILTKELQNINNIELNNINVLYTYKIGN